MNQKILSNDIDILMGVVDKTRTPPMPEDPDEQDRLAMKYLATLSDLHHSKVGNLKRDAVFKDRLVNRALLAETVEGRPLTVGKVKEYAEAQKWIVLWLTSGCVKDFIWSISWKYGKGLDDTMYIGVDAHEFHSVLLDESLALLYGWKKDSAIALLTSLLPLRAATAWSRITAKQKKTMQAATSWSQKHIESKQNSDNYLYA